MLRDTAHRFGPSLGLLFFDGASKPGWILTIVGLAIMFAGILLNVRLFWAHTSLFNIILMFVLLVGGIGLIARSLKGSTEGDEGITDYVDDVMRIPHLGDFLTPVLATIPAQLLAYHIATLRGTDVDQPRNLAKSVTVE